MTDLMRTTAVLPDRTERAREAVNVFRGMQPTLTIYAQALTGNKNVRVVMAAQNNGATDGNKIIMRPPIELGDKTPHKRELCGRRDAMFKQMCPACAVREKVLSTIYHEIAHIAFGTFEEVEDKAREQAVLEAIKETGGRRAEAIKARILNASSDVLRSHIALASMVNEFLPTLVNVLEDARVDLSMFDARRGTRKMFLADAIDTFEKGVEQKNAEGEVVYVKWSSYAMNAQVMIGVYCKLLGYDYSTWFHPDVVEALDDEKLGLLLDQFSLSFKAVDTFYMAIAVMNRLRELGFLGTALDPLPEPEPEPENPEKPEESDESDEPESDEAENETPEGSDEDEPQDEDSEREEGDIPPPGGTDGPDDEVSQDSGPEGDSSDEGSERTDEATSGEHSEDSDSTGGTGESVDDEPGETDESSEDAGLRGSGDIGEQDASGSQPENNRDSGPEGGNTDGPLDGERSTDSEVEVPPSEGTESTADLAGDRDESGDEPASADDAGTPDTELGRGDLDSSGGVDPGELGNETPANERTEVGETSSKDQDESADELELVDSGADDGYGGTRAHDDGSEYEPEPRPEMGEPTEELKMEVLAWGEHQDKPLEVSLQEDLDRQEIDTAIIQGIYFTTPSRNVVGVREHTFTDHVFENGHDFAEGWTHQYWGRYSFQSGSTSSAEVDESVISGSLGELRVVFSDNKRSHHTRHQKAGKIDARSLGKRAPVDDPRLFKKKIEPNKRDYAVILGGDISGSTVGHNLAIQKRAMFAQAELLHRLGIKFAVYCHSGDESFIGRGVSIDLYQVKSFDAPWDAKAKRALSELGPHSVNLDGHTIEQYRKMLDQRLETDRVLMYFTDGKMPAENEEEELVILKREIGLFKQKGYTLLGVGIRTDSPKAHGLDTVQINTEADTHLVVTHLGKRLKG